MVYVKQYNTILYTCISARLIITNFMAVQLHTSRLPNIQKQYFMYYHLPLQ